MRIDAEIRGDRIEVTFEYDRVLIAKIREVPGRKWDPEARAWMVPLSLESGRALRALFGDALWLGPKLTGWGKREIRKERNLGRLATADDAELDLVPEETANWLDPHQRADVAFFAQNDGINANQPGLGKTAEMICAVIEAGLAERPILVAAPISTHRGTWERHIRMILPYVEIFVGDTPKERERNIEFAKEAFGEEIPFWMIVNPEMVRYRRDRSAEQVMKNGKLEYPVGPRFPGLECSGS